MSRRAFVLGDVVAVLVFVAVGRDVHGHGDGLAGLATTSWPFLAGLVLGWVPQWIWDWPARLVGGWVAAWIATVAVGMALRVVAGQGIAFAFVLVALAFLGAAMLAWRLVVWILRNAHLPTRGGARP